MQWREKKDASSTQAPIQVREEQPRRTAAVATRRKRKRAGKPGKNQKPSKLSRLAKPDDMTLETWQIELRRQFGREQQFLLRNLGKERIFSEFEVVNPQTRGTYRVHIRGPRVGDNHCTCPDFATNSLGTCKHIEYTLFRLEQRRGGKKELEAGFQPLHSEVYLQYGARREVRFRPGSECPVAIARLASKYFSPEGSLLPEGIHRFEEFLTATGEHDHEVRCHEDVRAFVAEVRDGEHRQRRIEEAFPRGIKSPLFRDLVSVPLYDYQREGVLFAARAGRCLIGDEMGLGKTIQAIATSEVMARLFGVERVLIVCPTSLKHQWQREITRFVDRSVEVIYGFRERRERYFATDTFFKVTNYDTIYRDLDLIKDWGPDLVILDEAQRIKNWNTRTARSVKRIAAPYAMVLTGTPLENRLEELISIVQFVDQHRLGPTYRLLHDHQVRDAYGKVIGYRNLDRIGQTLEPVLVRRQKDAVLDQLPERIDNNIFVPMTKMQEKLHGEALEIVARIVQKWRLYGFLTEADKQRLMIALQRMRMSCDNSYLVDHRTDHGVKTQEVVTLLEEFLERPDTKVVIFSQWLRMHELIIRRLKEQKLDHVLFHGGVPGAKRKDLVDRFRDDPKCRLFLSTDAGGTGLNLQHASVVINMDLPWNPAVLEQRIGRVHRLGQKQPVRVVNFVAKGTIEESMLSVLAFKKSLFAGVLDGGEKDIFLGGSKFSKFMETVEKIATAIPQELLDDAEEALHLPPGPAEAGTTQGPRRRGRPRHGPRPAAAGPATPAGDLGQLVQVLDATPQLTGLATAAALASPASTAAVSPPPAADPWTGLLQMGVSLLQQFAGAGNGQGTATAAHGSSGSPAAAPRVVRDEQTGETYLKLPAPPPEVLEQALHTLGALLESMRR